MANRSGNPTKHEMPKRSTIIREPAVVRRLARSSQISKFASDGTIAAAVMVFAALLAVMVANSALFEPLHHIFMTQIGVKFGHFVLTMSIEAFVNDFLMAIFFLLVGIELKYEVTVGELRRPRQAALPMLAAVGGVAIPALIFIAFNWGGQQHGWAIPIATDIAFALGVMSLLGDKIAAETKVFFQTLAIADDILAIVVIALFYGHSPSIFWMAASGVAILILWGLNRARIYTVKPYIIVGLLLWACMYKSGIHATLAGVILAFFLPAKSDIRLSALRDWLNGQARKLDDVYDDESHVLGQHSFTKNAEKVEHVLHHVTPPLVRVEREISVPVNFIILPLFAFVNAQIRLVGADFGAIVADPVALGAFFGAVLGKPLGIIGVTWVLVTLGFSKLPKHVSWDQVIAVGIMGGMGFTMSILIAGMAFRSADEVLAAKCAILLGSVIAGVVGILFVRVHDAIAHRALAKTTED
ncbi:MAG: Na+/H+ antiporter NhaA [Atopobium sp.]|uniref:Na+/H+ antiporter NhaA n=1 Tax=Atopobium sp. TaxID=1872650 RepID=UPI002A82646C|nr:Na+/H+ antiporter NhaA [Atopobium sp.]MDY4522061.1 Na+/H+ antiporter NhaA [Atopobium sp.]